MHLLMFNAHYGLFRCLLKMFTLLAVLSLVGLLWAIDEQSKSSRPLAAPSCSARSPKRYLGFHPDL